MTDSSKEPAYISLVLYVHNKEIVIKDTLERLWQLLDTKFDSFEFIIVDDASSDRTADEIRQFTITKNEKKTTLIRLTRKHGLETAMQVGLEFSIGDFVIELDSADIHFNIDMLYNLFNKSCEGFDIVSLQPETRKYFSSRLFYTLLNRFLNTGGYIIDSQIAHILTRRAVNAILQIKDRTRYRKILHTFSGYKKAVLPVALDMKIASAYSLSEKIKMSFDILFSFTDIGIRLNIYIALFFFFFSVFTGGYAMYQYLTYDKIIEGWTTLMLVLSTGFSGLFFVLSITNKYLSIALGEIRTSPRYTVKSIEKL
jgi:polyisoprenyl-phosphate glycosyltransferase